MNKQEAEMWHMQQKQAAEERKQKAKDTMSAFGEGLEEGYEKSQKKRKK